MPELAAARCSDITQLQPFISRRKERSTDKVIALTIFISSRIAA
jgi:hypothetical protein